MRGQTLILRADGSETIGTGHVMRALAFGQHWRDNGGTVVFLSRVLTSGLEQRLSEEGFHCQRLRAEAGSPADAAETREHAQAAGARWVGVDCQDVTPLYQQELKRDGHRVLLVDDYPKPGHYCADVVVNTDLNLWQENLYADRAAQTRLLLGPEYALLRRDFLGTPPEPLLSVRSVPHILVTFGGSDPENMTEVVLQGLVDKTSRPFAARVVIGNSNPKAADLQRHAGQYGQASIEVMTGVRDMPPLMRWADVAVVASGITVWEFLYLGVPCLCWARHDVDRRNLSVFERLGALVLLPQRCDPVGIVEAIFWLADNPARASALARVSTALVDGRGASRILAAIRHLDTFPAVSVEYNAQCESRVDSTTLSGSGVLRRGGMSRADAVAMLPVCSAERAEFLEMAKAHFHELNPDFVPHDDWKRCYFDSIVTNPDMCARWIVAGGERVGFILFGLESHRFLPRRTGAIYEMYLTPGSRRHGIGRQVALQAIEEMRLHSPSKIQLEVTEGNEPAFGFWRSLGFERVTERFVLPDSKP
jgi:UDP-2,4-diacetamido-2,4,6-trideoxy-beta-L-altropyranose hydrolase